MELKEAVKLARRRKTEIQNPGWTESTVSDHQALIAMLEFAERQHKDLTVWAETQMLAGRKGGRTGKILEEARAAGIESES